MKIYIILFLIHLIINVNIFAQEKNELANDPISINYNIEKIYDTIIKARPASVKGQYFEKMTLSSTMGPGILINHGEIR